MSVGENIRRYRKLRGMTQAQLAEAVGLTEGAVRHYESGIRAVKPELLESIAAALGVSVNALKDYGVETGETPCRCSCGSRIPSASFPPPTARASP